MLTVSGLWAGEEQNGDREETDGEKFKRRIPLVRCLPPNANPVRIHWPYVICFPPSMQALTARTGSIQFSLFPGFCKNICHTKPTGMRGMKGMKEKGGKDSLSREYMMESRGEEFGKENPRQIAAHLP